MPLSSKQREALSAEAKRFGVDEAALIAAAEEELGATTEKAGAKPADKKPEDKGEAKADPKAKPPLYQYHLPFVTVNEVRTIWLELPEIDGGDMNAAEWTAAKSAGGTKPDDS